jgi:glycerol-3-phosphate acyltransferase PlsY
MNGALLAVAAGSYLLGSIPSGYLLGLLYRVDVRERGSGNIGATNVARSVGASAGLATLAIDMAKGATPVLVAAALDVRAAGAAWGPAVAAVAAVCGHVFPVFLGFRGGKGVATTFGALAALTPAGAAIPAAVFAATLAGLRYVSVASIAAALSAPAGAVALDLPLPVRAATAILGLLIVVRHAGNVRRLAAGTEPRIGSARKS